MGGMTTTSKTNPPSKTVQGLPDGTLRTTMTHVEINDMVLVQPRVAGDLSDWVPAPAKPTKRAVWAKVHACGPSIRVEVEGYAEAIVLDYAPQTAITIKDREAGQVAELTVWCNYCPPSGIAAADMSALMGDGTIAHLCGGIMCRELCDDDGAVEYSVLNDGALVERAAVIRADRQAEVRVTGGRYAVDGDARMLLATRAMAVGYTREDAAQLMDDAYWVGSAPYGDECETHPGLRRYTDGDCRACTVELLAAEREVPRGEDGSVDWQATARIVRSRDTDANRRAAGEVVPVRVPATEPQRRALRLLGELETSGARPQINGGTLRVLERERWVKVADRPDGRKITLTADALAWLASEHTAEVTSHVLASGVTVYGATCNCGPNAENRRMRRVPWSSGGLVTAEDAIAVALGHGEVSRPRYEAPSLGERLAAEEAALPDPERSTCGRCSRDLVWVHEMWIGVDGAEKCPNGLDGHKASESETSVTDARVTADDVAGLPTPAQAAADHAASRPWTARGSKRKSSSKATKRRRVLAGAR